MACTKRKQSATTADRPSATSCLIVLLLVALALQNGCDATILPDEDDVTDIQLLTAQDDYVNLNNLLEEKVDTEDLESNFMFAHDLMRHATSGFGEALTLFVQLGEMKNLYQCNAADSEILLRNQDALRKCDRKKRVSRIFAGIRARHAQLCQDEYETLYNIKRAIWDREPKLQQRISAVMDKFMIAIQEKDMRRAANIKVNKTTRKVQRVAGPRKALATPAQAAAAAPQHKRARVIKKRSIGEPQGLIDPLPTKQRKHSSAARRGATSAGGANDKGKSNLSMLKKFLGTGLLFSSQSNRRQQQQLARAGLADDNHPAVKSSSQNKQKKGFMAMFSRNINAGSSRAVEKGGEEEEEELEGGGEKASKQSSAGDSPSSLSVKTTAQSASVERKQQPTASSGWSLDIPLMKRAIATGKYTIDSVRGAISIWDSLFELAEQDGQQAVLENKGTIKEKRQRIDKFVRDYVLAPCERFHQLFNPVFEPARYDLTYYAKSSNKNQQFYKSFAHFNLCKSFIDQKDVLIGKITTIALDEIALAAKSAEEARRAKRARLV